MYEFLTLTSERENGIQGYTSGSIPNFFQNCRLIKFLQHGLCVIIINNNKFEIQAYLK